MPQGKIDVSIRWSPRMNFDPAPCLQHPHCLKGMYALTSQHGQLEAVPFTQQGIIHGQ